MTASPYAAPASSDNQSHPGLDAARAALAAFRIGDRDAVVQQVEAALLGGLYGDAATHLLGWLTSKVDRGAGLRLIRDHAVSAGAFKLYDRTFEAAFLETGDADGLIDAIHKTMDNGRPSRLTPEQQPVRDQAVAMGTPPILLVTLPKSGTIYLRRTLELNLGLPVLPLTVRTFPRDRIVPAYLDIAAPGGCILSEHMDANPETVSLLVGAGIRRVAVHVRDPRQALISWVHHVVRSWNKIYAVGRLNAPDGFPDLSFEQQVDWMIANHLPDCVTWIEEWAAAADQAAETGLSVWMGDFAAMKRDETAYVQALLDHFGIAMVVDLKADAAKEGQYHFRKGETDEWRRVCTPAQQDAMTAAIPRALADRFGWS